MWLAIFDAVCVILAPSRYVIIIGHGGSNRTDPGQHKNKSIYACTVAYMTCTHDHQAAANVLHAQSIRTGHSVWVASWYILKPVSALLCRDILSFSTA